LPAIVFAFVLLCRSNYFATILKSACKCVAVLAGGAKRFILRKMPRRFNLQDSNEGVTMKAIVEKSAGIDTLDVSLVS
jgi:hypothetical protein